MIAAAAQDSTRPLISIERHANGAPYLRIAITECGQCYGTGCEEFRGVDAYPCDLCEGKAARFVLVGKVAEEYADRAISRGMLTDGEEAEFHAACDLIARTEYAARPFACPACNFRQQIDGGCINCGATVALTTTLVAA